MVSVFSCIYLTDVGYDAITNKQKTKKLFYFINKTRLNLDWCKSLQFSIENVFHIM